MEAPNVLILDEPTNDLDIRTLTILESYLDDFDGVVIVVSHDRYFLDRVVRRLFAFEDGRLRQFEGNYSEYQLLRSFEKQESSEAYSGHTKADSRSEDKAVKSRQKPKDTKIKFTYNEQKEWDTIEDDIAKLEEDIEKLDEEIALNARDFVKLGELTKAKEEAQSALDEKMDRWMYLTDKFEKINNQ